MPITCFCDSQQNSEQCCFKFISGEAIPRTALELMRSRYTAFVIKNKDYLVKTWHNKKAKDIGDQLFDSSIKWISLEIVTTEKGLPEDNTGYVEFKATFVSDNKQTVLHENSKFKKNRGLWFYVNGIHQ